MQDKKNPGIYRGRWVGLVDGCQDLARLGVIQGVFPQCMVMVRHGLRSGRVGQVAISEQTSDDTGRIFAHRSLEVVASHYQAQFSLAPGSHVKAAVGQVEELPVSALVVLGQLVQVGVLGIFPSKVT